MDGVVFHEISSDSRRGGPEYKDFTCGFCGRDVHGRFVLVTKREDPIRKGFVLCGCGEGTAVHLFEGEVAAQWPPTRPHHSSDDWPEPMQRLFDEAATAFAAGAHTSAAMICRKALMVTSHGEGASDDETFGYYVDFLADEVLSFPRAREAIDRIRNIGNAANHEPEFVSKADAEDALNITRYLLGSLYAFPGAVDGNDNGGGE